MAADGANKSALHLATHSGWYRFEWQGEDWVQVDPDNPQRVYIGTEHSGLFVAKVGGKDWVRANPNVPCLTLASLLALPGKLLAGTMPAALYVSSDGNGWQELKGVRHGASGGTFPPNPELSARTRVLAAEKGAAGRLYAGIEVGGILVSDDGLRSSTKVSREPTANRSTLTVNAGIFP